MEPVSKKALWTGWILSILPAGLLLFSGVMKFIQPEGMDKELARMGWDIEQMAMLGSVELACTVLYLFPQTAVLGAILLTGYMGGAIATHVRIGDPIFMHIGIGVAIWLGVYLREPRLRAILPWR
ncbi:MAG: DoxX family protein [Gemmataceae bacterium]